MDLMSKPFRPIYGGRYMMNTDGYIYGTEERTGAVPGMFILPGYTSGTGRYNLRCDGKPFRISIRPLLEETWGIIRPFKLADVNLMREKVLAHREEFMPEIASMMTGRRARAAKTKSGGTPLIETYNIPCPFASGYMTTTPMDVKSWDDPRMDPMTNRMEAGVWVGIQDIRRIAA